MIVSSCQYIFCLVLNIVTMSCQSCNEIELDDLVMDFEVAFYIERNTHCIVAVQLYFH